LVERLRDVREAQTEKTEKSDGEPEREFTERSMRESEEEHDVKGRSAPEIFVEVSFRETSSSSTKRWVATEAKSEEIGRKLRSREVTRDGLVTEEQKTPAKRHGFSPDCQFERVSGFGSVDLKARRLSASSETAIAGEERKKQRKETMNMMKEAIEGGRRNLQ
jgi:hypothetical protein